MYMYGPCPSAYTHLLQQSCYWWKHVWRSCFAVAMRLAVFFCWISPVDGKYCSWGPILSLGKSAKLHGAWSGEYGGSGLGEIWLFTKTWCCAREIWQDILLWCRIQLFLHFNGQMTSLKYLRSSIWKVDYVNFGYIWSFFDVAGRAQHFLPSSNSWPFSNQLYQHTRWIF